MAEKNIVLVGFMGSGKSLTSKRLADTLQRKVLSTDKLIVQREGREITDIFQESGEAYFRKVEKEAVKEASGQSSVIIDCGGGVVLDPENMAHLRKSGRIFYLEASPEYIYDNIKDQTHRPLLNVVDPQAKIAELLDMRRPYYEKADVTVNADQPIDQIAEDIIRIFNDE